MKPPTVFDLEESWKDIVSNPAELCETAQRQQDVIWELVTTERTYILMLKQMRELYEYLKRIQEDGMLQEIDPQRVFSNYSELYEHNIKFWREAILPLLGKSREHGVPLDPSLLKPGFDRIDEWWPSYANFLYANPDCYAYVKKCQRKHKLFREFVSWAESLDAMQRQRLSDTLTNPMQRLTRYSLLLRAVHKRSVDKSEKDNLIEIITRIEKAIHNVEEAIINRDSLNELSKHFERYSVVDSEELEKVFPMKCDLRLTDPMPFFSNGPHFRRLFFRSDLKLKDGEQGLKVDAHCILFTDLFLICEAVSRCDDRLRILKPPIHIAKLYSQAYSDWCFVITATNDFGMPVCLYYLYPPSVDETKKWLEQIKDASCEFKRLNPSSPLSQVMGFPNGVTSRYLNPKASSFADKEKSSKCGISPNIVHRKCVSMGSIKMVQQSGLAGSRSDKQVSSAEQLGCTGSENHNGGTHVLPQRLDSCSEGKLASADAGQSKSCDDFHLTKFIPCSRESRSLLSHTDSSTPNHSKRANAVDDDCSSREKEEFPNLAEVIYRTVVTGDEGASGTDYLQEDTNETSVSFVRDKQDDFSTNLESSGRRFGWRYQTLNGIDVKNQIPRVLKHFSCIGSLHKKEGYAYSPEPIDYQPENRKNENLSAAHSQTEIRSATPVSCLALDKEKERSRSAQMCERRSAWRYHTSDGIEAVKQMPKVLKRFSWSLAKGVCGSSSRIRNRFTEQHDSRQSRSMAASPESYSSPTSGISTSSSNMEDTRSSNMEDNTIPEVNSSTEEIDFYISKFSLSGCYSPIPARGNTQLEEEQKKFERNDLNLLLLPVIPPITIETRARVANVKSCSNLLWLTSY